MPNTETTPVHSADHAVTFPTELPQPGHATSHFVAPDAADSRPLTPDLPGTPASAPLLSPTTTAAGGTHTSEG